MTGKLRVNEIGRWEIVGDNNSIELSSGSVFEMNINGAWKEVQLESKNGKYFCFFRNNGVSIYLDKDDIARTLS